MYDYVQQINSSSRVNLRPAASGSAGYGDLDLI